MKKEEWINGVRVYLDNHIMGYLHSKALETEDIVVLNGLLLSSKILLSTYVYDADYYLKRVPK